MKKLISVFIALIVIFTMMPVVSYGADLPDLEEEYSKQLTDTLPEEKATEARTVRAYSDAGNLNLGNGYEPEVVKYIPASNKKHRVKSRAGGSLLLQIYDADYQKIFEKFLDEKTEAGSYFDIDAKLEKGKTYYLSFYVKYSERELNWRSFEIDDGTCFIVMFNAGENGTLLQLWNIYGLGAKEKEKYPITGFISKIGEKYQIPIVPIPNEGYVFKGLYFNEKAVQLNQTIANCYCIKSKETYRDKTIYAKFAEATDEQKTLQNTKLDIKVKRGKNKITVSWKKPKAMKGGTYWVIPCDKNGDIKIKSTKKNTITIKGLKKGMTYDVRVIGIKKIDGADTWTKITVKKIKL